MWLCGLLLLGLSARKNIRLVIDGRAQSIETSAWRVGDLLEQADIQLAEEDRLSVPPNRWLQDGDVIEIATSAQIAVQADDDLIRLVTSERLVRNILGLAGIPFYSGDRLYADGRPIGEDDLLEPAPAHALQVKRSFPITLSAGGQVQHFSSTAATLGEALEEQGIHLLFRDRLEPSPETPLTGPVRAELKRSVPIEVRAGDAILRARVDAATVGEALSQAGIPLQGLDYSLPSPESPLPENGKIQLVRVQESLLLETEPIPFETEIQPVADLELDQQEVVQNGVYGLKARRIRVRSDDGQEVSRRVEEEYVAVEPEAKILGFGTKIVPHTAKTPDGVIKYWRALNMYAVSYNPTSAGDSTTATGATLRKGIVAIDPSIIPYGTQLYIPGYGKGLAADTGGGVVGRLIDLGYSDDDYVSWHQWVTVYFLWPPPENVVWVIP